jgi:peptide/nickel transport system substrate-binding protein
MRSLHATARLLVAGAVLAAGVACSNSPAVTETTGSLTVAVPTDVAALDPQVSANGNTWRILNTNYETLVGIDDQLKPTPKLASGWKQTSPRTYLFDIRKGVKFSNGRELTTDDVVGSLQRLVAPKTASFWAGMLGPITGIKAVGTSQVEVTLAKPRTAFLSSLANVPAAILPMKEFRDGSFDPAKQVLGTGPYQMSEHKQDESWTLVRNQHYWGEPAKAETLTIKIISDDTARTAALRAGSIQVATFDAPDTAKLLQGQSNLTTVMQKTTNYFELLVNAMSSVFSDQRLRQALALSIDRAKIVSIAMGGAGQPNPAITPPGLDGSCDLAAIPYATPDLDKARQLVNAAGARGKTISIVAGTAFDSQIAQVLQQNLQAIGLTVKIEVLEAGIVSQRVYSEKVDFDLAVGWFAGYNDPSLVTAWWNPALAGFNKAFMKPDPELNALIDKGFTTPDGPARTAVLQQACDRAAEGANMIPLVTRPNVVAYRPDQVKVVLAPVDTLAQPLINVAQFELA